MNWEQLYSAKRTGQEHKESSGTDNLRNEFQRDFDRIIFSSAFRRLQNKTQVFPLPGAVFVHNRLTHSLEVASVGRSLGKAVGDRIAEKYNATGNFNEFYTYELPSVIAAACLAHDIGNPPFGHSGEDSIRSFFNDLTPAYKQRFESELSENQQRDFLFFEGNANAIRTLVHHFNEEILGGFRLTYTTLAAVVKYPSDSLHGFNKQQLSTKKSGYFDSEIETWTNIANELGIPKTGDGNVYARHPFVYLTEAADDICYRIIDFEDAHRLGIISAGEISDLFLAFFDEEEGYVNRKYIAERVAKIKDANKKVQYLRAMLINLLIQRVTEIFLQNEEALLAGTLNKPLLDLLPERELQLIKRIDSFSVNHIYNHRSVVEIEIAGYHVIGGLLQEFVDAVMQPKLSKSKKLLQLMSEQFPVTGAAGNLYSDLQSVVDYIAGMTDLYAVDLFRKIKGMDFPELK